MTANPAQALIDHQPTKEFFIGIDSDGCAFDSMEIKQKECFTPNTIKFYGLQAVSKYAREACEFVNLYSQWRGVNRFPAVVKTLDLLEQRREVLDRKFQVPRMPAFRDWVANEPKPDNPALEAAIAANNGEVRKELEQVMAWSKAVNVTVADIVKGVPPFPFVREALVETGKKADLIVVSATPCEALEREWEEHDIAKYVLAIAGQEMGKKAEHLKMAAVEKYPNDKILMIGDAPGDLKAARANNVLFYPILPGSEQDSWKRLIDEASDRFYAGEYSGSYEDGLIEVFMESLPSAPSWE